MVVDRRRRGEFSVRTQVPPSGNKVEDHRAKKLTFRTIDNEALDVVQTLTNLLRLIYKLPEYNEEFTYKEDELTVYEGSIYRSLTDDNLGNTPSTEPSYWKPYLSESITSRLEVLEDRHEYYEIYESINATSGTVTIPDEAEILLDKYSGAGDCLITELDSEGRPEDEAVLDTTDAYITATFDVGGNYSLSAVPRNGFPVSIVYQIKIPAQFSPNVTDYQITNIFDIFPEVDIIGLNEKTAPSNLDYLILYDKDNHENKKVSKLNLVGSSGTGGDWYVEVFNVGSSDISNGYIETTNTISYEIVSLNGLVEERGEFYNINSNRIEFIDTSDIEIGDVIDIHYQ